MGRGDEVYVWGEGGALALVVHGSVLPSLLADRSSGSPEVAEVQEEEEISAVPC